MCPHQCPGLSDCWGEEFEKLYTTYEKEGKYMKQVSNICQVLRHARYH